MEYDSNFEFRTSSDNIIFSFLGRHRKRFFPLVYILTCRKNVETYTEIFRKLIEAEPRLKPKYIMCDFEMAAIEAAKRVFTESTIKGFFFHFSQCVFRQIQANGLQQQYAKCTKFSQHIRTLMALAFVPPNDVIKRYGELKKFAFFQQKLKGKTAIDVGIQKVLQYMEKTWIGYKRNDGELLAGRFPIELWNMYNHSLEGYPRTNNGVEGWHNSIRLFFGISHPSIFKFISGIKQEQNMTELSISQSIAGIPLNKNQKKSDALAVRIKNVIDTYEDPEKFQLKEYLFGISSAIQL